MYWLIYQGTLENQQTSLQDCWDHLASQVKTKLSATQIHSCYQATEAWTEQAEHAVSKTAEKCTQSFELSTNPRVCGAVREAAAEPPWLSTTWDAWRDKSTHTPRTKQKSRKAAFSDHRSATSKLRKQQLTPRWFFVSEKQLPNILFHVLSSYKGHNSYHPLRVVNQSSVWLGLASKLALNNKTLLMFYNIDLLSPGESKTSLSEMYKHLDSPNAEQCRVWTVWECSYHSQCTWMAAKFFVTGDRGGKQAEQKLVLIWPTSMLLYLIYTMPRTSSTGNTHTNRVLKIKHSILFWAAAQIQLLGLWWLFHY